MEELFNEIFEKHKNQLLNMDFINPEKILIVFAGIPGSGKTEISKQLENRLKGIRISSADAHNYIKELSKDKSLEEITIDKRKYVMWVMDQICKDSPNKLIILDKGIERTFPEIEKWANDNGYRMIVVSLYAPIEILKDRITQRNGSGAQAYFEEFDRWESEYNTFMQENKVDLELDTEKIGITKCAEKIIDLI